MERTMRNGGLDLLLILTVLLALGTIVQDYRFDSSIARERAIAAATDRDLGSIERAAGDLHAASAGALVDDHANGWTRQVADRSVDIEQRMASLRDASANPTTRARLDAAVVALADVLTIDRRARDALAANQRSLATGLVRVDGREAAERLTTELGAARDAEITASQARQTRLARLRFGMNTIALLWVVVVALYAGRLARRPPASPAATMAQMIRELPPPVKSPAVARAAAAPAPAATTPPSAPAPAPPPPAPVPLGAAANLCVDLARLMDARDLPALLERTADVLQAKGVIIWSADEPRRTLRPWLAHGYGDQVLSRLGVLPADDDNVTSLAFRSASPQTINGGGTNTAGAIAVPLITAAGCSGVLAVEVRDARPTSDLTALATIVGAQFATLIGPPDQSATQAAEA
jgi:hypothetical protein